MVDELVYEVRSEKVRANISFTATTKFVKKETPQKVNGILAEKCPKCKGGIILKGKAAYGCSNYKNGCEFKLPFIFLDKKISEKQFVRLLKKGCTVNLKGFKSEGIKVEGLVRFDENFQLILEEKKYNPQKIPDEINCPKCKSGIILKGKSAYGCSNYKNGCDFVFSFDNIRKKAAGKELSKELVYSILNGN